LSLALGHIQNAIASSDQGVFVPPRGRCDAHAGWDSQLPLAVESRHPELPHRDAHAPGFVIGPIEIRVRQGQRHLFATVARWDINFTRTLAEQASVRAIDRWQREPCSSPRLKSSWKRP